MAAQQKLPAQGAVLQINAGLIVPVLSRYPVQPFGLRIDAFILLQQVIFLQPAGVFKQDIGISRRLRNYLMCAGKRQGGVSIGKRIHK
ncbi:hypothetical protein [Klebsiella pneumoniae]|uniref:hypothetical protein n=1 Tax=Klebsiella pneumoniae TaxID=573 RepID=UPI002094B0EE|nr:hypothetical protein [Klebsiella pneumoniae]